MGTKDEHVVVLLIESETDPTDWDFTELLGHEASCESAFKIEVGLLGRRRKQRANLKVAK